MKMTKTKELLCKIGLAKKAGGLLSGTDIVCSGIRERKVLVVIVSSDLSENTAKRLSDRCRYYDIRLIACEASKEELGAAIGKPFTACVGITDKNLSELICRNL